MKKVKIIGLILAFSIGFTFPSCEKGPVDSCDGVVFRNFFDVKGLTVSSFSDFSNNAFIPAGDTIALEELDVFFVDYDVDYLVNDFPKQSHPFYLMPTANACSYIPGGQGSKEEGLVNFTITTLNDFDSAHLAGSSLNDLFLYSGSIWEPVETPIPLAQFLSDQTENLQSEDMLLKLEKAPELNSEFRISIRMELSTGEIYEQETMPIYITP